MTDNVDNNISKIDALIAAAQARKAAKEAAGIQTEDAAKPKKEKKPKKDKVTSDDEETTNSTREAKAAERAQKKAQIEEERAQRRAAKEEERRTKRAEKETTKEKKTAHMSKVERAEAKLPVLDTMAQQEYNDIIVNFPREQIAGLALWLQHYNRVKATERSLDAKLNVGDQVDIIGGDPKHVGKTGTLVKVQRIRCYVEVPGVNKPVYLFTSDVSPVTSIILSTGTEG